MQKNERIVRYTAEEIDEMLARGESQTNWERLASLTDEEIEASIDFEEEGIPDFSVVYAGLPPLEVLFTVRVDTDIFDFFRAGGADYQTRINAVLRSYIEAQKTKSG